MIDLSADPRYVLGLPLDGVQLIEASAGTGKTYTLANLYLRHVVGGRDVSDIAVVSYTEAATDELRGRIRARLSETLALLASDAASDDGFLNALAAELRDAEGGAAGAARRLRLALRTMDDAAIYTIHGFCQRVLSEFAFLSGQQLHAEVLVDDRPLWREALRDWWRTRAYPLDRVRSRLLAKAVGDLDAFMNALAPVLGAQPARLLPDVAPLAELIDGFVPLQSDVASLARRWAADGERIAQILRESKSLSRAQKSGYAPARLEEALRALDGYFADSDCPPPPAAFEVLTRDCIDAQRLKAPDANLDDGFFSACGALWSASVLLTRQLRVAALFDAAAFSRERVTAAKTYARVVSFDDLLTRTLAALEGSGGDALAQAVRRRFPVAMIDEFQDTDAVQYGIFRALYRDQPGCGLVLIGDPKQAIYSFRGGDVFAYMAAKRDVGATAVSSLNSNWRSTPELVQAVNAVFAGRAEDVFVYGEAIAFSPAHAAAATHRPLVRGGVHQPALRLWVLPAANDAKGKSKVLSKDAAASCAHAATAQEIARLIAEGRGGAARLGERTLRPRDIAVLVRTAREGAALREALALRGVNAVAVARESVLASEEAAGLEVLLAAVLNPRDRQTARAALTSSLLAKDYAEIEQLIHSDQAWLSWVDSLLALHRIWQRRGFIAMFQRMLRSLDLAQALARSGLAERRLTNLQHLGELLQRAAKSHAGMDALLSWYRRERAEAVTDETQLRLESDEELVQIVTIHASKGLEYPIVFVPYLWGCTTRSGDAPVAFHDGDRRCLDAGSDDADAHRMLAERERLAEDVRLLYVALTRAASALYVVWGKAGSRQGRAAQTALGYLLHPRQAGRELAHEPPAAFTDADDLRPDLRRLEARGAGAVRVEPLPEPEAGAVALEPRSTTAVLAPQRFAGRIAADWHVQSFSALTREVHSGAAAPRDPAQTDPALSFPAGAHVGSFLHKILERLDFRRDVERQVLTLSAQHAGRFGLEHALWGDAAARWLARVVQTPLDGEGMTLAALDPDQRLNELEFDFATDRVDIEALNSLLQRNAPLDVPPLDVESFRGLVTGVVDLVFVHEGRYYLVDYKSNFLGSRFDDYTPRALQREICVRRYDLQYLLYTLALHRYLRRRLSGYDYARHFGGVYDLFLRGLRPETGPRHGVHFEQPARALIEALDSTVFRCGAQALR